MKAASTHPADKQNPGSPEPVPIQLQPLQRGMWVAIIGFGVINALLLIAMRGFLTYYRGLSSWEDAPAIKNFYTQANLATENVVASWYSSMLLLLVGLLALLCHGVDRSCGRRRFSGGWLVIAAIFSLLSFDEMGSMHERVGMLGVLNPSGDKALGWVSVLVLPIVAVAIYMIAFGWISIRSVPVAMILFALGTVLLVLNPLMEKVEMDLLMKSGDTALSLHDGYLVLEEGSEIFAFLSFAISLLVYASTTARKSGLSVLMVSARTLRVAFPLAAVGFVVALLAAIAVRTYMQGGDIGEPANWPPSALATVNALLLLLLAARFGGARRGLFVVAAAFCVLVSLFHGACMRHWLGPVLDEVGIGLGIAAACLALPFLAHAPWLSRAGIVTAVALFVTSLQINQVCGGYLDVLALAVFMLTLAGCFLKSSPVSAGIDPLANPENEAG